MRHYAKARDAAEPLIVEALRKAGATVHLLSDDARSGLPDLLVGYKGRTLLVEVKNPEATRSRKANRSGIGKSQPTTLSESQEKWHQAWRGDRPAVVRTPAEALALLEEAVTWDEAVQQAEDAHLKRMRMGKEPGQPA